MGILFTTIVLMISFSIHGSDGRNASDKDLYSEESQASQETEKQDNLSSGMDESKNVPEDEVITNQKPGDTTEAKNDADVADTSDIGNDTDTVDASDNTGATVTIEVYRGEVCRGVAEDLQACGLVEDSEEFRLYMDQMGYDQKLRVGTFEIPRGASFEEIAQILIN